MRTIFSLILLVLTALASAQSENKIDLAGNDLRGPVKSSSLTVYFAKEKFGELEKDGVRFKREDEFNKQGFLTYTKEVLRSITTKYQYKYDSKGKLIEESSDDGDEKLVTKYKYNDDGTLAEVDKYDAKGKLESRRKNKYFNQRLSNSALYNGDGSVRETKLYIHKGDKLAELETYDEKGKLNGLSTYTYTAAGKIESESNAERNSNGDVFSYEHKYTYDNEGRVIKHERLDHENRRTITRKEYDANGNLVKEFSDAENSVVYEYKYDKHNNWTEQVEINTRPGSVRKYLTVRQINYY